MVKLEWTEQALKDVDAIAEYISLDSLFYAKTFTQKIFNAIERLELFPKSGRIVPEINNKNIREIILGNYRIIYRIKLNLVEIISVYHSSRLLDLDL